jgi:thiol-disulfide isomerase/thioredoxin
MALMSDEQQRVALCLPPTLVLAVAIVIFACLGGTAASAGAAPSVVGVDLAGKQVDPLHASPGKVVVLIFVRTDCPISNRYAPTIQRISAAYAGKAAFWLVYPDKTESSAAIERHLHEYGYKLPALHDPQHALVKLGQAQVTPEVAVFDASGQLVYHGRIDNWYVSFGHARPAPTTHELDDAIHAAVKGNKPQVTTASGIGCYISDLE